MKKETTAERLLSRSDVLNQIGMRQGHRSYHLLKKHWSGRMYWHDGARNCFKAYTLKDLENIKSEIKKDEEMNES